MKKAKRKLLQLKSKKQKLLERDNLEKIISDGALRTEVSQLLLSSSQLGQTDTLKRTLSKDLIREKLGLPVEKLYTETEVRERVPTTLLDFPLIPVKRIAPTPCPPSPVKVHKQSPEPVQTRTSFQRVNRPAWIESFRQNLPILSHEQEIMESINSNLFTIICGETGSGKSTQIPQFLYESGYALHGVIGVTQPRRVAAISLATRVAEEMCSSLGQQVGYQIRYDASTVSGDTIRIKYMTDGILLKEISNDFLLKQYSVIVIDEAHERSVNTDILIALLSRITLLRKDLANEQQSNSLLKLVIMSATLRTEDFTENPQLFRDSVPVVQVANRQYSVDVHYNKKTEDEYMEQTVKKTVKIHRELPEGGILVFLPGKKEVLQAKSLISAQIPSDEATIYGLYSLLSPKKQMKIFAFTKPHRLIVISTNIAETSVTIPNIKYVVDPGLEKRKFFSSNLQLAKYRITRISKASAEQRAGRAGRTCPGHCYRLYSNAAFSLHFEEYRPPPILESNISNVILSLKTIGITDVFVFPFPTVPPRSVMVAALTELGKLGALRSKNSGKQDEYEVTEIGRELSRIPLSPRYAKMLVLAEKLGIEQWVSVVVSALEIENVFIVDAGPSAKTVHSQWFTGKSDVLNPLKMYIEYTKQTNKEGFCEENLINQKSLVELEDLRKQVLKLIGKPIVQLRKYPRKHEDLILKTVVAGLTDHIARKLDSGHSKRVPYNTETPLPNSETSFIHPSSFLFSRNPPLFVAYQHLVSTKRPSLLNNIAVNPAWLYELGDNLSNFTIIESPKPIYDPQEDTMKSWVSATFGALCWELPAYYTTLPPPHSSVYFLYFLLTGEVFPSFAQCQHIWDLKLRSIPSQAAPRTQKRVAGVVQLFTEFSVCSRVSFLRVLSSEKSLFSLFTSLSKSQYYTTASTLLFKLVN